MNNYLMVDCETLDTKPSAVVLSVGVCLFNPEGIISSAHWSLALQHQINTGRTINADTLAWWMQQTADTRERAFAQKWQPRQVLEGIGELVERNNVSRFWAHSPAFDYIILESLFRDYGRLPWDHRSWLDTRTAHWMTSVDPLPFEGKHDAEADAIHQAEWVIRMMKDNIW